MTEAEKRKRIEDKFTWHAGDLRKVTMAELQKGYADLREEITRIEAERKGDNGKVH